MGLPGEIAAWWLLRHKSRYLLGNVRNEVTPAPPVHARVCGPTAGTCALHHTLPGLGSVLRVRVCLQLSLRTFKVMPGTEPQPRTRGRRPRVACLCRAGQSSQG